MKTRGAVGVLCLMLTALSAKAVTLTVGTPADSQLATPSKASPQLHGVTLNFDSINAGSYGVPYTAGTVNGVTITSPDGLSVIPFSTQSGPNELFDDSADGSANLTIGLNGGTTAIGVGIADIDPVSVTFEALGAGGTDLGTFLVNLATTESTVNVGNGYYVISDINPDIFGLEILEPAGNANYSGLAIDDVQVAPTPEPASLSLMGTGLMGLVGLGYRRFKRA